MLANCTIGKWLESRHCWITVGARSCDFFTECCFDYTCSFLLAPCLLVVIYHFHTVYWTLETFLIFVLTTPSGWEDSFMAVEIWKFQCYFSVLSKMPKKKKKKLNLLLTLILFLLCIVDYNVGRCVCMGELLIKCNCLKFF